YGLEEMDITAGGGSTLAKNVAKITAKGVDINIVGAAIKAKQFRWGVELNINYNKDRVEDYYLTNQNANAFVSGSSISAIVGDPVYNVYSYKWAGLDPDTGDPQGWLNGEVS